MSNIIEWTKSDIGDLLENTLYREKWRKKTCIFTSIKILRPTGHGVKRSYIA